jgi:hypothetical protein
VFITELELEIELDAPPFAPVELDATVDPLS